MNFLTKREAAAYSPLALAFLGDSVYDTLIREYLLKKSNMPAGKLHAEKIKFVCAEFQSEMYSLIENVLTEKDVLEIACDKKQIMVGEMANFIAVSNDNLESDDVLKTLVWTKSKRDVKMTVYKGEILQKNGKIFMQNMPQYGKIIEMIKHQRRN